MKRGMAVRVVFVAVALMLGLLVGIQPASAKESAACQDDFGTKVPVLLVHGFDSNPGMWLDGGPKSMRAALSKIADAQVVDSFDYTENHFDWVTNSNIGPKLALTIDCLAQASLKNGGPGKVIVVAHLMGGLATRFAAGVIVDGRSVMDELGLVITLGTPQKGSSLATVFGGGWRWYCGVLAGNVPDKDSQIKKCETSSAITAMQEGSSELAKLPHISPSVRQRAIAGDVTAYAQLLFTDVKVGFGGDIAVPTGSATGEYTVTGSGDGRFVFQCDIRHYDSYGPFWNWKGGQCSHNELYKTGYIQESVVNGIRDYLASLGSSLSGVPYDFYGMTLILPPSWEVEKQAGGTSRVNDPDLCVQGDCARFDVDGPEFLGGLTAKDMGDLPECGHDSAASTHGPLVEKGTKQIGGKPAAYYEASLCSSGPTETMRVWEVTSPHIIIATTGLVPPELDAILNGAQWK